MTLQYVIRSKKPFKRILDEHTLIIDQMDGYLVYVKTGKKAILPVEDLLAGDWVVVK